MGLQLDLQCSRIRFKAYKLSNQIGDFQKKLKLKFYIERNKVFSKLKPIKIPLYIDQKKSQWLENGETWMASWEVYMTMDALMIWWYHLFLDITPYIHYFWVNYPS